jgi:hypothetical protein
VLLILPFFSLPLREDATFWLINKSFGWSLSLCTELFMLENKLVKAKTPLSKDFYLLILLIFLQMVIVSGFFTHLKTFELLLLNAFLTLIIIYTVKW